MDKLAAEKIAHEYFQVGVELALQDAGLGMNKTASRDKDIAKMLGLGGAGALGGAALMKAIAPDASESIVRTMAKKSPVDFAKAMYHIPGERLGIADARAKQMLANADLDNMDLFDRLAATSQAFKPSNLEDLLTNKGLNPEIMDGVTLTEGLGKGLRFINPLERASKAGDTLEALKDYIY